MFFVFLFVGHLFALQTNPAPPQASDQRETLVVTSEPDGAEVFIDENLFGNTPATLKLTRGRHTLRVTLPGYRQWTRQVVADPGAEAHLIAWLVKTSPGSVTGRVLWNEQPVADVRVVLRHYGPSTDDDGTATTDATGHFTIANVPDGSGYYLDLSGNQPAFSNNAMVPVDVLAGTVTIARDAYVCKPLVASTPTQGQTVNGRQLKLQWQPFPQAASYSIRVWRLGPQRQYVGVYSSGDQKTGQLKTPNVQLDGDLNPGPYLWRADAFNAAGHVIGCSLFPESFTVGER